MPALLTAHTEAYWLAVLEGTRVLDLTDESGQLAAKILGDLGADVVAVEPTRGKALRHRGPFLGGQSGPERSLAWHALNTSKRSVCLSPALPSECERLRALARQSDVWIDTERPEVRRDQGLDSATLHELNPRLVICSITPFGQDGPYAGYLAGDLVVVAMGGNLSLTGSPDRPPLRCSMPSAYYHAAPEAALGIVMALYAREDTGRGQLVDLSLHETQLQTLLSFPAQQRFKKQPAQRVGPQIGRTREIWQASDGFVSYGLRGGPTRIKNLIATVEYMDECGAAPEWLKQTDWKRFNHNTLSDEEIARLEQAFGDFFRSRSRRELYEEALKRRIFLAPCNDAQEILEHRQLRERELFTEVEVGEDGARIELPGFFAKTENDAVRIRRRAPRLGEHQQEVFADWGVA